MTKARVTLRYDLTRNYLDLARAALMPLYHPPKPALVAKYGRDPLANAIISIVSITIIYSYLAIESFVNYRLFLVWQRRGDDSAEAKRFLAILGNPERFLDLRRHKMVTDLGERVKTLCAVLGYKPVHIAKPRVWQDFRRLSEMSRHFLVHPVPDSKAFQTNMNRIALETPSGKYCQVAEHIIAYLYEQSEKPTPVWVSKSTLLTLRGAELLVGKELYPEQLSNKRLPRHAARR